jgi:hypothetical protein
LLLAAVVAEFAAKLAVIVQAPEVYRLDTSNLELESRFTVHSPVLLNETLLPVTVLKLKTKLLR